MTEESGLPGRDRYGGHVLLGHGLTGADQVDPPHDLGTQVRRHVVMPAAPLDQLLHGLFEPVLLQARRAFLEVLLELVAIDVRHLTVEELVQMVEYVTAVRLVRLSAAHEPEPFASFDSHPPAGTSPRSRA